MLERQRGPLQLSLEDGTKLNLSDRHLTFKLQGASEKRISVYRLRIVPAVPEHLAAGYEAAPVDEELAERVREDEAARGAVPHLRIVE